MTVPVLVVADTAPYLPTECQECDEGTAYGPEWEDWDRRTLLLCETCGGKWRGQAEREWVPVTHLPAVADDTTPRSALDGPRPLGVGDVVHLAHPCPQEHDAAEVDAMKRRQAGCVPCDDSGFVVVASATVTDILPVHDALRQDLRPHLSTDRTRPNMGAAWWDGNDWRVSDPDNLIPGDWSSARFGLRLGTVTAP